jgi:hypothetical protein
MILYFDLLKRGDGGGRNLWLHCGPVDSTRLAGLDPEKWHQGSQLAKAGREKTLAQCVIGRHQSLATLRT